MDLCHRQRCDSLLDADLYRCTNRYDRRIAEEILAELKLAYLTPADTREAGYIQTQHFGVLFPKRSGRYSLTAVPQRWLRDLLWDYLAGVLRSPQCPRTASFMDCARKGCVELGAFLQAQAPGGGHDPALLRAEHIERYVAEVRRRERLKLPTLKLPPGATSRMRPSPQPYASACSTGPAWSCGTPWRADPVTGSA